MYKVIKKFFYDLAKRNWGAPYHFIIVMMYFQAVIWFFNIKDVNHPVLPWAFAIYLIVSITYSTWQLRNRKDTLKGVLEDALFEIAGFLFAILPLLGQGLFYLASLPIVIYGRKPKVCLDPGHGGEDPGALYEIQEKNINLKIAKIIKSKLKQLNIDSILTREDDETVNLGTRCSIANQSKSDLYVSIHANASPSSQPRGIQIYYLSNIGKQIAQKVFDEMMKVYPEKTPWCYIGEANFYVLRYSWAPAILIECGFLSNEEDRVLLTRDNYLDELTDKIVLAIADVFEQKKQKGKNKNEPVE